MAVEVASTSDAQVAALEQTRSRRSRSSAIARWGGPLVALGAFLLAISFIEDSYLARIAALMSFWVVVSMAWNLIGGYAGQVFLGNAAFVGLGAYASVILLKDHNVTPWLGFLAAAVVCTIAALLTGIPTLRLTGIYFSLATLAYPLVLQPIATWAGYHEVLIPARSDELYALQFRDLRWYAVILAVVALGLWYATGAIERSRWFVQLQALRHDEAAARSTGVSAFRLKLAMFVLSAVFSGIAGVVYAQMLFVVSPETVFGFGIIIQTLVICFLGGVGRRSGPILGTLLLVPLVQYLDEEFSDVAGASNLAYGLILMFVIILIPNGLIGSGIVQRFAGRRELVEPPSDDEVGSVAGKADATSLRLSTPAEASAPILEAVDVSKRYGEVAAVQGVSLAIRAGEFVGVVGPNGAGKTTLFDLITGFQTPTSGTIQLRGSDVTSWGPDKRARAGIRRTFQIARPLGELTVFENAVLGAQHQVEGGEDKRELALNALATAGLIDRADTLTSALVPSQLRLLELARALAGRPALLFLDEPFAGLDIRERDGFVEVLKGCCRAGLTIVLVDHDIRTVAASVERLFVLDNGSEIACGDPQAVIRDPAVVDAYLGARWHGAEG
ncbi:MAG: ATP-binding cassette domain-containing protein [Solirubrobacterales bacterium]